MKTNDLGLYSPEQVAEMLGVSRKNLIDNLKAEVRYVVVGKKRIMFDPKDVRAYINRKKSKALEVDQQQNV